MRPATRALWQLHLCVFLWGFTAILGRLITLPALALVWWRLLLVVSLLLFVPRVRRGLARVSRRLALGCATSGAVVSLHWLTFYGAIKLSNASVATTSIALAPAFVALVEPVVARKRFDLRRVAVGLGAVPGVALVVGDLDAGMRVGFAVGVLSALLVAVFAALNKRLVDHVDALTMTCVELGAGLVVLSVLALLAPLLSYRALALSVPGPRDALLIAALATACTLLPFALSLVALRHLSAYAAQLTVNLEPVYSVVLAALLLGEGHVLGLAFYAGVAVILAAAALGQRLDAA